MCTSQKRCSFLSEMYLGLFITLRSQKRILFKFMTYTLTTKEVETREADEGQEHTRHCF